MATIPIVRKAMIIIAVSKYKEPYANLPGTLTSADRLASWARTPTDGRGYDVLEINDANNQDVTVDRLRKEITGFLETRIIDRLVVYFAGHGLVRSAADQFWLLTNASQDRREGVELMGFIDGIKRYSIGSANPYLKKGQLCIIADACRNTTTDAINFVGDPILTNAAAPAKLEVDMFLATTLGAYAYQPQAVTNGKAYCLFSDVLTDALDGKVPQVIDNAHPFGSVIDNQLLANYLDTEVPKRARAYNEDMEPDTMTGLRRACNYYDILASPALATGSPGIDPQATAPTASERIVPDIAALGFQTTARASSGFGHVLDRAATVMAEMDTSPRQGGAVVSEFDHQIAAPRRLIEAQDGQLTTIGQKWRYEPTSAHHASQIFVRQRDHWTLAPVYPFSVSVLLPSNPGDVLVQAYDEIRDLRWDTSLSTSVAGSRFKHRRMREAITEADQMRENKAHQPLNADLAAYIYHMVGDYDNIVRTAHYMERVGFLTCDLALLAATEVRWYHTPDGWTIEADLPGVDQDNDPLRPGFATIQMEPSNGVPVNTFFPVFRQGWRRMADLTFPTMPPAMRQLAQMAEGYSAVVLPDAAIPILLEHFDYVIHDQGPEER